MKTLTIIIVAILVVGAITFLYIVGICGPRQSEALIMRELSEFEKNPSLFSKERLEKLRMDLNEAIHWLEFTIQNRESFISANSNPQYSEYAAEALSAAESVRNDRARLVDFKEKLASVEQEIARR